MTRSAQLAYRWVYPLAAILLYAAVFLRAVILFRNSPYLVWVLSILFAWLVLAVSERAVSTRLPKYFVVYLAVQTILVFLLLNIPDQLDFFAVLLMILSM